MATLAAMAAVKSMELSGWYAFFASAAAVTVGGYLDAKHVMPALFPPDDIEGPRMRDMAVQTTQEGAGANRLYGEKNRVAGTVIWQPHAFEKRHKDRQGGKGGSGGAYLSYTQHGHCAIEIARTDGTPVLGVNRVYANGTVLWQSADDAEISSNQIRARAWPQLSSHWGDLYYSWYLELYSDTLSGGPDLSRLKSGKHASVSGFVDTVHPLSGFLVTAADATFGDRAVDVTSSIAGILFAGDTLAILDTPGTYTVAEDVEYAAGETQTVQITQFAGFQSSVSTPRAVTASSVETSNNRDDWQVIASGTDDIANETWVRLRAAYEGHWSTWPIAHGKAKGDTIAVYQEEPTHSTALTAIRFYLGTSDQLPDPLITEYEELEFGTGNICAYRNCVYAVIEDLELTDFGNAMPNFEFEILTSGDTSLSSELARLLGDWGIAESEFDVSGLSATLRGYHINGPQKLEQALQPLAVAYHLIAREDDGAMLFRHRYDIVASTLPTIYMGAHSERNATSSNPMELQDESEFRAVDRMFLQYRDSDRNLLTASRKGPQAGGASREVVTIDLPVAMTGDEAQQLVNVLHALSQVRRRRVKFTYSPLALDILREGNAYNIDDVFGENWEVLIDTIEEGASLLLSAEGHVEDSEVYTQTMTSEGSSAAPSSGGSQDDRIRAVSAAPVVEYAYIDVAGLSDQRIDTPGFFVAACAADQRMPWRGAVLFESLSQSGEHKQVAELLEEAVMGVVDVLPAHDVGIGWWDRKSTIEFRLYNTTVDLASVTEAEALRGQSLWWVSGEVMSIVNLELLSIDYEGRKRYRGTKLLRGLCDTDDVIPTHIAGREVIVKLDGPGLVFVEKTTSAIGEHRWYKAVASGGLLADALSIPERLEARTVLPMRVTSIAGTRDASDNLTVTWERQTRRTSQFLDQPESLDEDREEYRVIAFSGGDAVRQEVVQDVRTWSYSAVNQTADGLTPGDPVVITIEQASRHDHWGRLQSATV